MTSLRPLPIDQLVATLVSEHAKMKKGLDDARKALADENYAAAKETLYELDQTFRQHIADEEGQVLRLLLKFYGRESSEDTIRVFRQHRPIYRLMEAIEGYSTLSPEELSKNENVLKVLLDDHTHLEERKVFPLARSVNAMKKGDATE